MTKPLIFRGCATALITPFQKDHPDRIDSTALHALIHQQVTADINALVVAGTTGEASALSPEEHRYLITESKKHAGSTPIIAGCGAPTTAGVIALAKEAADAGADAILVVTPYYNKCSQEGLVEHYGCISESVTKPIIVYNVPSRTGVDIKPETYKRLSQLDNIVATKEANGNLSALMKTMMLCGDDLDIYCGNDDQSAAFTLLGGKGTISVLSNILPQAAHDITAAALDGDADYAAALQLRYLDLCSSLFCDVNPMPVKYAMSLMGTDSGICRLPLTRPSDAAKETVCRTLRYHGLIE